MSRNSRSPLPRSGLGFSLIELMISMLLGLILIAGVGTLFAGSRQAYRSDEALARLQETVRVAFEFVSRDLRAAGYYGCFDGLQDPINTLNDSSGYRYDYARAVQGHEAQGNSWSPELPDSLGSVLPGTDVVTIRSANGTGTRLEKPPSDSAASMDTSDDNPGDLAEGDIVVISDCQAATVLQVTDFDDNAGTLVHNTGNMQTPGNATQALGHEYPPGSRILKISTTSYFIRNSSFGDKGPSLFRKVDDNSAEELVEGVENMQIRYGEDSSGDGAANVYHDASQVAAWNKVVSVRISLLVRSTLDNVSPEPQRYRYDGTTATASDHRIRLVSTYVVALRNALDRT